jgi:transposase
MRKARKTLEFDPNQIKQLPTEQLVALIVEQQQVIEELQQEVERLKLTLQKDSRTSSKPPSRDLLLKPEKPRGDSEKKEAPKRKPGGQPGHLGKTRKGFKRVDRYDQQWISRAGYEAGKLLRSLRDKQEQWWYFLDHPQVPPDNNLAERSLRLAVTKRKVSGGSRSMQRFQETANLLSVVQTCRRQGRSVLKFFHSALNTYSKLGKSSPSLLPDPVP